MRRLAAALALALAVASAAFAQETDRKDRGRVRADVHVGRILVDALVLDAHGNAIPDLTGKDFRAKVAGRAATVEAAEWIPAEQPEEPPVIADGRRNADGRILLFLVETSITGDRMVGLLRVWHFAYPLLSSLLPTDRVAVLAWTGHLRLVQDFTSDREKVKAGLKAAILGRHVDDSGPDAPFPSLAPELGGDVLEGTQTVERALAAIGEALETIGGAKALVFLGWGVAVNRGPSEYAWLARADAALRSSRTTVFTLDPTDADFHTLERGLQDLSASTGGLYAKTNVFPGLAVEMVKRALAGRYVLVLVAPEGLTGPVALTLASRRGSVTVREKD